MFSHKDDVKIGPVWMMDSAANLYNESGLFADSFIPSRGRSKARRSSADAPA